MGKNKRKHSPKTILKLPVLEQWKSAVLNSLTSRSSQRSYDHTIREFIDWHCSEPRLAFNKVVVTRYPVLQTPNVAADAVIGSALALAAYFILLEFQQGETAVVGVRAVITPKPLSGDDTAGFSGRGAPAECGLTRGVVRS